MNPFDHLVAVATKPRKFVRRAPADDFVSRPQTKTGVMRAYLQEHGKATARELAAEAELHNTGMVMGLLKADIARGAVRLHGGHYEWVDSFDDEKRKDIQAAIRMLKANGYSVRKVNT